MCSIDMQNKIIKHENENVCKEIQTNVLAFINKRRSNLVFRGVSSKLNRSKYTKALTIVGEKGNYFRKQELFPDNRKDQNVFLDKFDENSVISHSRNPSSFSKYVSTSRDFQIAKTFAEDKKDFYNENAFIIMAYIENNEDAGLYKEISRSHSSYSEDETQFLHAIFSDRIIGLFSQDNSGEFSILNINPALYYQCMEGIPKKINIDQTEFNHYKELLNYQYETWKE